MNAGNCEKVISHGEIKSGLEEKINLMSYLTCFRYSRPWNVDCSIFSVQQWFINVASHLREEFVA